MRAIRFLLNRHRAERLPMLLFAILVGGTAFLAAAAPRGFNRAADDGLRHVLAEARPVDRNLQLGRIGTISDGEGMSSVAAVGEELEADLPASIGRLIADRSYLAESANWSIRRDPGAFPAWLRFRFGPGTAERVTYREGRPPSGETRTIPGVRGTQPGEPEDATVFEVALAMEIADALDVGVGDRLELVPDTDDVLVGQFSSPVRAAADVVGLYRVDDPADPFWMNDPALELPSVIVISPDLRLIYATALLSEDAYPALIRKGLPARYTWREFLDPDRLDAEALGAVTEDLRRLLTQYPPFVTSLRDADTTTLRTGLLDLLSRYATERRTAEAILLVAALGPAAVAAFALALLALLLVHRRQRPDALVRGRGASASQVLGSYAVEGMILAGPAAALGFATAWVSVPTRPSVLGWIAPAAVAIGATVILVGIAARHVRGRPDVDARDVPTSARAQPRRLVAELFIVILAAGGAYLLRQRGIAGSSTVAELESGDLLLAAAPALIGLAVGLLAVRLYPLPLRVAEWFSDGWRGSVPALGLHRAARSGDTGSWPLIVLLVTVAIGTFSSTVLSSVERGQVAAAWQEVGADFAVTPGTRPFPGDFDASSLPGVDRAARAHVDTAALGRGGPRVELHALDTAAYAEVTAGTEADADLPRAMRSAPIPDDPIPAILSRAAASSGARTLRVGDEVELLVNARVVTMRVSAIRDRFPGSNPAAAWLVVPLDALRAAASRDFSIEVVFLRAPAATATEIRSAMDDVLSATTVAGRSEVLDRLRSGPLIGAVAGGFLAAVVVAVVLAAIATTAALVLLAATRRSETAHLRILGFSPRDLLALSIIEHGPAVLGATLGGVFLGIGVAWFVAPGLGLAGLIGSPVEVELIVDWRGIGALLAALGILVSAAIVAAASVGRRGNLSSSARRGIE